MTEVDYGGGGECTRLETINLCVYGVPPPPYIKEWRRGPAKGVARPKGGVQPQPGVGLPHFPIRSRRGKEEGGGKKERGGRPPSQFGLGLGGGAPPPLLLLPPFH